MKRKFDFSGKRKTSFIRNIRINPLFLFWKKNITVFLTLLIFIFVISILSSTIKTKYEYFHNIKQFLSSNFNYSLNINNLHLTLEQNSKTIKYLLEEMKKDLPNPNYSYLQPKIKKLENFIDNISLFSNNLFLLQKDFKEITTTQKYEIYIKWTANFIESNQKLILSIKEDLIFFKNEIKKFSWLNIWIQKQILELDNVFSFLEDDTEIILNWVLEFVGQKTPHNIIILLQNSDEKRATGGFIGSFVELTMNDWKTDKMMFKNIYEYDYKSTTTKSPPELVKTLVWNDLWALRDSNYSPNFEVSAKSFIEFYEKAWGNSVDTIIAIDNHLIWRILDLIWGITVRWIDINSSNFSLITSYITEWKLDKKNHKSFLKNEIIPMFKEKLKSKLDKNLLLKIFQSEKNNVLVYSKNKNIKHIFNKLDIGNKTNVYDKSIIGINQISISWNKSDAFVMQNIKMTKKLLNWKEITTIKINRKHTWNEEDDKYFKYLWKTLWKPNIPLYHLKTILGHGPNNTLLQFFVDEDSSDFNLSSGTFRTWKENGKKIVEVNLPLLNAGEKQEVVLEVVN